MPSAAQSLSVRPVRVMIAHQAPRERRRLIDLCHARGGLASPLVAGSGAEALAQIRQGHPDLALLACELQDMSGFDVLRALGRTPRPATIMVAPDERHAVEALAFAAADYLTMPVSEERFGMSIDRAVSHVAGQRPIDGAASEPRGYAPLATGERLVGERAKRLYFLTPAEIDYVEADSNYVRIHVGADSYMNRDSLRRLSPLLERLGFVRVSRSVLLNLQRVAFAERVVSGALTFTLASGTRVTSSTAFRLEPGAYLRVARPRGARPRAPKRAAPDATAAPDEVP